MERLAFLFLVTLSGQVLSADLPKEMKTCHRSDPSFSNCLVSALGDSLKFLKNGNAAFNMPPIDPYRIKSSSAEHSGGNANFHLSSTLKEVDLFGISTANVTRVATKFANNKLVMKAEVKVKNMELSGDYTMVGQILVLPIKGIGKTNITLEDVTARIELKADHIEKDGETYMNITTFKLKLTPKFAHFYFENVFKGDPVLTNTINNFMNENWELVFNTLFPGYEAKWSENFKEIGNKIFNNVPMKIIFPE